VSTLVHANKTNAVSREGGSDPFDPTVLGRAVEAIYQNTLGSTLKFVKPCGCLKNSCTPMSRAVSLCVSPGKLVCAFPKQEACVELSGSIFVTRGS
jgi:hypothetical protein